MNLAKDEELGHGIQMMPMATMSRSPREWRPPDEDRQS
jgi:hypothetical protein